MIRLRQIESGDEPFLYDVYSSTREEELACTGWSLEDKQAFLTMQFHAQHRYYHDQFPDVAYSVVLDDETPVGRLYLLRASNEFRIIDIALLPAYRGKGIGGGLLRAIIEEADRAGLPVRIHVERSNPALRLYQRLGFGPVVDAPENPVYLLLERRAAAIETPAGRRDAVDTDSH